MSDTQQPAPFISSFIEDSEWVTCITDYKLVPECDLDESDISIPALSDLDSDSGSDSKLRRRIVPAQDQDQDQDQALDPSEHAIEKIHQESQTRQLRIVCYAFVSYFVMLAFISAAIRLLEPK